MPTLKQELLIAVDGVWFYNLKPFEPPGPREWSPSRSFLDIPEVDLDLWRLWKEVFEVIEGLDDTYVFAKRKRKGTAGFVAVARYIDFSRDIDLRTLREWKSCVRAFQKRVPLDLVFRQYSLKRIAIEIPVKTSEEALFAVDILEALTQECGGRT